MFLVTHIIEKSVKKYSRVSAYMSDLLEISAFGNNEWPFLKLSRKNHETPYVRIHRSDLYKFAVKVIADCFRLDQELPAPVKFSWGDDQDFTVSVRANTGGIEISIDGYGTYAGGENDSVIYLDLIEFEQGERIPAVYVWADARQEDPTHSIDLSQTRNDLIPEIG